MSNRLLLVALVAAALTGCASSPTPAGASSVAAAPVTTSPKVQTLLNMAATSQWVAEERLLPQQPILALVDGGGTVNAPAGVAMTCNPDNSLISARLGKQPATRIGQTAAYKLRLGAQTQTLEGKFVANPKNGDADFVFPLDAVTLRTLAQLDSALVETDQGEIQWQWVRDPSATPKAKYVGSLKNLNAASSAYLVYCNPK